MALLSGDKRPEQEPGWDAAQAFGEAVLVSNGGALRYWGECRQGPQSQIEDRQRGKGGGRDSGGYPRRSILN